MKKLLDFLINPALRLIFGTIFFGSCLFVTDAYVLSLFISDFIKLLAILGIIWGAKICLMLNKESIFSVNKNQKLALYLFWALIVVLTLTTSVGLVVSAKDIFISKSLTTNIEVTQEKDNQELDNLKGNASALSAEYSELVSKLDATKKADKDRISANAMSLPVKQRKSYIENENRKLSYSNLEKLIEAKEKAYTVANNLYNDKLSSIASNNEKAYKNDSLNFSYNYEYRVEGYKHIMEIFTIFSGINEISPREVRKLDVFFLTIFIFVAILFESMMYVCSFTLSALKRPRDEFVLKDSLMSEMEDIIHNRMNKVKDEGIRTSESIKAEFDASNEKIFNTQYGDD